MPGDSQHSMPGQTGQMIRQMLQKLQAHHRASVSARIAQRSMSTFTLQPEPVPDAARFTVPVAVYPQNPFVGEPEVRGMYAGDIHPGLMNSRVRIIDDAGQTVRPNADDGYLYQPGEPAFVAVNAFYYTTFTLRLFERYAQRSIPWAFGAPRINVNPHVGDQANAFYNEQEQLLGFHTFTVGDSEQYTASSADIVSHETGHAVLDGLRYLYNESFGLGCRAFHESFGDIAAVLVALHDETLMHQAIDMTGGNLHATSFVTEIAEYLTGALQAAESHFTEHTIYLRNAFNTLDDVPFDDLPPVADDPAIQPARQEHSYSRVFTGAFYEVLVSIYDELVRESASPIVALHRARDIAGRLLVSAIELGPVGEMDFSDMARAFLTADQVNFAGRHVPILRRVFAERKILSDEASQSHLDTLAQLPDLQLPDVINNTMTAALYLEETILPALKQPITQQLLPLSTYRNSRGQVYMSFYSSESLSLNGSQYGEYDGSQIEVFGGLTLMFNPDNRLCSLVYRPVTESDRAQIRVMTADLIAQSRVTPVVHDPASSPRPLPGGLWIGKNALEQTGPAKLVTYPVMFDDVPEVADDLRGYLQSWLRGE